MNKVILVFAPILFFVLCSNSLAREKIETESLMIKSEKEIRGIVFPAGTRIDFTKNGLIYYVWPGQDFLISGIKVLKGTQIMVWENGQIRQLWAKTGQEIGDITLQNEGTWVGFKENGKLDSILFAAPEKIREYEIVQYALFYNNGEFKQIVLSEDQPVGMCYFKSGEVTFHPNGMVMGGILAKECYLQAKNKKAQINDEKFLAGTRIYFDDEGLVVGAFNSKTSKVEYDQELSPTKESE